MKVNGTGSWCVPVEYVKDNYYARFHAPNYHRCRDRHFRIFPAVKFRQSQWSVKCRSRVPGYDVVYARFHDPCFYRCRERHIRILLDVKFRRSQWNVKCRSRVPGHGVCL